MNNTRGSASHPEAQAAPESVLPSATATVPEVTPVAPTASPVEPARAVATTSVPPPPAPTGRTTRLRTVALAGVVVLVLAAIALPRRPPAPGAADSNERPERREHTVEVAPNPQPISPAPAPRAAPVAVAVVAPRAVSEPSKKQPVQKPVMNLIAESAKSAAPVAAAAAIADAVENEDSANKLPVSEPMPASPAPAAASTGSVAPSPVTITGCLEVSTDEDAFRLTDAEGVDAPKSRSWRTGFLRKRSAHIALVAPPDRLVLKTNIGKRVAATGLLTGRELTVNSLRVVGPYCY